MIGWAVDTFVARLAREAWLLYHWRRPRSSRVGRGRDDVFVSVPLRDQARVQKDAERDLEGRARDVDVRRPAAELLVARERRRQHGSIDVGEERGLRLGDPGGRRGEDPRPGLAVGAHE